MSAVRIVEWAGLDAQQRLGLLQRPAMSDDASVAATVTEIIGRVRRDGDEALYELSREFRGRRPRAIAVEAAEIASAGDRLTPAQRSAITSAAANIEAFHRAQMPVDIAVETARGVRCERVSRPIPRVGLYVPAGSAPLPSTALMLGVPARIAGCRLRVLCSPAQSDDRVDPAVLYAAQLCGIEQVFAIGGAEAIAAMAYGTQSVPRVDKIFGPGNPWVTAAKAQVSRDPHGASQDMPAGPSEVMVVADDSASAEFVAADLLSQAEHGNDSQVLLVTDSRRLAGTVADALEKQLAALSRSAIASRALESSCAIIVDDLQTAIDIANEYAPEHLIMQVEQPRRWLGSIYSAGSVFLGPWAPESVGDYCSGTNHVLPTYGYARSYSSLGLGDFIRSMTVQELEPEGIETVGPIAVELAGLEGLDAHANAVRVRLAALRS